MKERGLCGRIQNYSLFPKKVNINYVLFSSLKLLTFYHHQVCLRKILSLILSFHRFSSFLPFCFLDEINFFLIHNKISPLLGNDFHGEIYDAVWTMALALRELHFDYELSSNNSSHRQMLADFDYTRKDMAENLMKKISKLSFEGASGRVSFSGANRIGTTALFQIQSINFNMILKIKRV